VRTDSKRGPVAEAKRIIAEIDGTATLQDYINQLRTAVRSLKAVATANERRMKVLIERIDQLTPDQRRELSRRIEERIINSNDVRQKQP
jgi:Spy/CpxP family protein refolding chaperone